MLTAIQYEVVGRLTVSLNYIELTIDGINLTSIVLVKEASHMLKNRASPV